MFYLIHTYGCQMNLHESEKMSGILEERGFLPTEDERLADVIVFNTCCIRQGAEDKAMGNIGAVKKLKRLKPDLITVVCGCMPQQDGVADTIMRRYPFVDIVLGTHNMLSLGPRLDEILARRHRVKEILQENLPVMDPDVVSRSSGLNAWVNILYGCNNFCTYCIVPYVRGREKSRDPNEIEAEVRHCIENGYKEVTLLGQNVNSYGNDVADDSVAFAPLLKRLATIPGEFRIKYLSSHPKDFNRSIVEVMRDYQNVTKYVHLPVQSGSTEILRRMNRRYTREDYLDKVALLRELIPSAGISTDVMIGFPGETDEDFEATMDLVERVRFDNMFMFVYSRRSGTVADRMENQVPQEIKDKRIHHLVATHRRIGAEVAKECVGKEYRALFELRDGAMIATTDCGRFVTLQDASESLHGQFGYVKVIGSRASKLVGVVKD